MGRPTRNLTRAQVQELRAATAASGTMVLCVNTACANPVANDGAGDEGGLCALHRQQLRNAQGRCPNCGGDMGVQQIINGLTGRPRTQAGVPLTERACVACGYTQRERKAQR
jgi:hypothetical protein